MLRPNGHFLYADFRFKDRLAEWDAAIAGAPLRIRQRREINAEFRRGINLNSARSLELVQRHLPRFLRALGRDSAGLEGSPIHRGLSSGELSYRSYCFEKSPDDSRIAG